MVPLPGESDDTAWHAAKDSGRWRMHQVIGILGGMSPESTVMYYEYITRTYGQRFGDFGFLEILIYSVNFQKFADWQREGRWAKAADEMAKALERLRTAGADFGIIATNTMHIVFDEVQKAVRMPLLSIVDATAEAIRTAGLNLVGLLGTLFTMRNSFYRDGLARWGINVLVPDAPWQERINEVMYGELCRGIIRPESRQMFLGVIEGLRKGGAQGIVLGCTEVPLLLEPQHCDLPLFNTTLLHAEKALNYAIGLSGGHHAQY
jgi:aspartate racemase